MLSLLVPTHRSAGTIERTLRAAMAQRYRPLEICLYDEASDDGTREIVAPLLDQATARGIDVDFQTSEENSGPVRAWRVPLHRARGEWCAFVWADDVLRPDYAERMMAATEGAEAAGRALVFSSAELEIDGRRVIKYAADAAILDPLEFSLGIFLRRYSLNQVNGIYETAAARRIFDRHMAIDNPLGFDYLTYPYGNDVGFLSELGVEGGGVEVLGERLVTLVLSRRSMTRFAMGTHLWQFRWQYTWSFYRVWRRWQQQGVPGAARLARLAERRLALCQLMLHRGPGWFAPRRLLQAFGAVADYLRLDYERRPRSLEEHRALVEELRA